MIQAARLLADCQRLVRSLEDDLRERLEDHPDLNAPVRAEYDCAREGGRTGQTYTAWRDEYLTQVAVHWVLGAVFVRFLEDNGLLPDPWLAGPGARLTEARERQERFFTQQPAASDREYLLACFRDVESLPTMDRLFDERHNPLFRLAISADGARAILEFFRKIEPESGSLAHDFEDPSWSTRFLGDLYQDLSQAARDRYALLQTPEFIEAFILDRTLNPAMEEVGYQVVKLIDPACGSGHFLLGAFHRIFARYRKEEPGTDYSKLALRAIEQVAGVDVNPFAVAIARFRLLIAALKASEIKRLTDAPKFSLRLAAADSLLFGDRLDGPTRGNQMPLVGKDALRHIYLIEDAEAASQLLNQRYTVVVGNPPYITPKDSAEKNAYRNRFASCYLQYSLAIPFIERFFDLTSAAGWIGMITANSFMKRELGKKLIENYIPRWDLTHVIDTSEARIPGHGTPTVILLGRNRPPVASTIRAVMGIRGEPSTPSDPAKGLVWTAILAQIDSPGSQSTFVSVADLPRIRFHQHPWSLGGGGATDLKALIDEASTSTLWERSTAIGRGIHTGSDDSYFAPLNTWQRLSIPVSSRVLVVEGESIRNWDLSTATESLFPYDERLSSNLPNNHPVPRRLWPTRQHLRQRREPNGTHEEIGLTWFEWSRFQRERFLNPLSLAFSFVATHNHFAIDRGGKIFNRSAPVIKLNPEATELDYLGLLGLLNSSTGWFWMRQVFHCKGAQGINEGGKSEKWEQFFELDGTKLRQFPLLPEFPSFFGSNLSLLAAERAAKAPEALITSASYTLDLAKARNDTESIERRMIALQEELDWQVYRLYGLLEDPLEFDPDQVPEVALGERPFEIVLARKMAAGEIETKWFERHGSTPITEIPDRWPEAYRQLIEKRLKAIEENPWIRLIEQPEYKRRWNREPWEEQEKRALRSWLLDRLEDRRYWPDPSQVISTAQLADRLREDEEFRQVASLYRGRDDFEWTTLVTELALDEAVPFLAPLRYADSGMRKRADWEEVWRLQRMEDALDARIKLPAGDPQRLTEEEAKAAKAKLEIAVPPRYTAADFRKASYWRLRGKLDVPKERFIHYPGLERGADPSPVIGWAGWDHLQQAQALGTAFHSLREGEGWGADRLAPVLAGLLELLPWLLQWHNEPDPAHGERLGDFFSTFLAEETRALGLTQEELTRWRPAQTARRGRKPRA